MRAHGVGLLTAGTEQLADRHGRQGFGERAHGRLIGSNALRHRCRLTYWANGGASRWWNRKPRFVPVNRFHAFKEALRPDGRGSVVAHLRRRARRSRHGEGHRVEGELGVHLVVAFPVFVEHVVADVAHKLVVAVFRDGLGGQREQRFIATVEERVFAPDPAGELELQAQAGNDVLCPQIGYLHFIDSLRACLVLARRP